jgi:hypothetical protein
MIMLRAIIGCVYNLSVASKKGAIGIGVLTSTAAMSRNTAMVCGFFHSGPSFGGPNVGPQGHRLRPPLCTGTPTRSGCRLNWR